MRIDAIAAALGGMHQANRTVRRPSSDPASFQPTLRDALATHEVRRGDTLSEIIARRLTELGQNASAQAIYRGVAKVAAANGLHNPDLIRVGQRIDLSALGVPQAAQVATAAPPPAPTAASAPPPPRFTVQLPMPAPRAAPVPTTTAVAAAPVVPAPPPLPAVAEIVTKPTAPRKTVPVQTATLVTEPRVSAHRPWEAVLDGPARLTSEFGPRNDPFNGRIRDHEGIDLAASRGTKVYPLADGRVTFSGWNRSYGNVVIVSHGDGLETLYGHHERNHVRAGDRVSSSTALGSVGSTGRATAPHLHLEVHRAGEPVDPIPFMTGRAPLPSATPAGP